MMAFEIRMLEGIRSEMAVTTRNKKIKLNKASLIIRNAVIF